MDTLLADIRSGVRMLVRYPALSLVAVLTLGLGIGLSTTVFCVVNGGLFKGLPFPDSDRIVSIVAATPSQRQPLQPISVQDLAVFQQGQASFEKIGAFGLAPLNLSNVDGRPDRLSGGELTVAAFEALGVPPILGRGFREGDDRPGADPVMLIGQRLWRERFGGASDVAGQTLRVNGVARTIIGVMPETFAFRSARTHGSAVDRSAGQARARIGRSAIARLKPGVGVATRRRRSWPSRLAPNVSGDEPRRRRRRDSMRRPSSAEIYGLLHVLGAGIGVLLIACVTSRTSSSRASLRRREVAVRMLSGPGAIAWCGSISPGPRPRRGGRRPQDPAQRVRHALVPQALSVSPRRSGSPSSWITG
jgi:putative ABC transport system permease protein